MLAMKVDIVNEKVILEEIRSLPQSTDRAVARALARVGQGIFRHASHWLSGKKRNTGGFPVPRKTGHLRRMLAWVKPGKTKSKGGDTVSAGPDETIVYNTAAYADVIALGRGSSAKFGPRDFLQQALDDFNQGNRIARIIDEELEAEWS